MRFYILDIQHFGIKHSVFNIVARVPWRGPETAPDFLPCMIHSGRPYLEAGTHGVDASAAGEFHDQADAKWIGMLRGHNNTPCGQPTPGRPIGRPWAGLSAVRGLAALSAVRGLAALSAVRGLAALKVYLVFSVTMN
jgi:hypothetical protein